MEVPGRVADPVASYFQRGFGFPSAGWVPLVVGDVTLIVKLPLFQKVPKEKHTAEPPISTNESLADTTEIPMKKGRGLDVAVPRVKGHLISGWPFWEVKKQTSY